MKTENQPLKLLPHRLEAPQSQEPVIATRKARIVLPAHYRALYEMTKNGLTVSQMAEELVRLSGEWRFALLGRYMRFLNRAELLADRQQILLAEGLETETGRGAISGFLRRLFSGNSSASKAEIAWSELPLLRQLEPTVRNELLAGAHDKVLQAGETCIRQGAVDRSLFVVLDGRLAVAKTFSTGSRRKVVAFLDTGAVFGEGAFFFAQKRTADVVAVEKSRVLEIPHDERMKTVDLLKAGDLQTRIWFLQALHTSAQFSSLPSDSLDALLYAGERKEFRSGQKIIQEGDVADACYFIVQGRASVSQNMTALGKLQNGDVFGEIALMKPGTLRTATVIAETDVLAIRVEGLRFWNLLKSNLPLAIEVEKLAKRRLAVDRSRLANR